MKLRIALKSVVSIFVAAMMLVTLLVGCGKSAEEAVQSSASSSAQQTVASASNADANEPGYKKTAGDKAELSWYMNFSWLLLPEWKQDLVSQKIEEITGNTIKFIIPAGNEAEKMNTMIASGELPDIMTMWWGETFINDMISADMLLPLNKLADEHDPYFYKVANKEKLDWYRSADGNVYGYPNASVSPSQYEELDNIESTQSFLVRKDIYEAIGSPNMSTPEGFLKALEDAKAKFPTVEGQPLIPMGFTEFSDIGNAALGPQLQNFLAVPNEKDNKINDRFTDLDYVKWLKTFRNANEKGLIAKDVFVDKTTQITEKMTQGRYFAIIYPWSDCQLQNITRYNADPNSAYIAVDGPKNSAGAPHTLEGPSISGWCLNMISKNCKRADKAIQLFSYLMSEEGQNLTYCGVEGVTYDVVDGKHVIKDEIIKLRDKDGGEVTKKYGILNAYWMFMDQGIYGKWEIPAAAPVQAAKEWSFPYATNFSIYSMPAYPANSEESIAANKIDLLWGKTLPQLLLAKTEVDFDKILGDFTAERSKLGFDKILAYKQAAFENNKAKLGK